MKVIQLSMLLMATLCFAISINASRDGISKALYEIDLHLQEKVKSNDMSIQNRSIVNMLAAIEYVKMRIATNTSSDNVSMQLVGESLENAYDLRNDEFCLKSGKKLYTIQGLFPQDVLISTGPLFDALRICYEDHFTRCFNIYPSRFKENRPFMKLNDYILILTDRLCKETTSNRDYSYYDSDRDSKTKHECLNLIEPNLIDQGTVILKSFKSQLDSDISGLFAMTKVCKAYEEANTHNSYILKKLVESQMLPICRDYIDYAKEMVETFNAASAILTRKPSNLQSKTVEMKAISKQCKILIRDYSQAIELTLEYLSVFTR